MIIHLNGWPGVGKRTIGEVLARRVGARFIHNHLLHDVAIALTGVGDPDRWPLYEKVRAAAYDELARRPVGEHFVMTNALCTNAPRERDAWAHVVELAMARHVPLVPVVLEAVTDELVRRVQSSDRVGRKVSDPNELLGYLAEDTIQKPAVPELLVLDVTRLLPEEVADRIAAHVATTPLMPAGPRHLELHYATPMGL